ncbi:MAG: hypothetical protein HQL44_17035 [Alphaproteobacteria bacterium]|nr:hypothetical protein [Alphaproteobacteria bacterium]
MSLSAAILQASVGPGHPVGKRLREWLAPYSEKALAKRLGGIDLRTVRSMRQGNWPCGRHLLALVENFGVEFLEFVFAPALAESDRSLERRLERLEAEAGAIKRDLIREKIAGKDSAHSGVAACASGPVASGQGQKMAGTSRRVAAVLALIGVLTACFDGGDDWLRLPSAPHIARVHAQKTRETT